MEMKALKITCMECDTQICGYWEVPFAMLWTTTLQTRLSKIEHKIKSIPCN